MPCQFAFQRDALVFLAGTLDAIFELALGWPTAILAQ
jgi:hypothetical protein